MIPIVQFTEDKLIQLKNFLWSNQNVKEHHRYLLDQLTDSIFNQQSMNMEIALLQQAISQQRQVTLSDLNPNSQQILHYLFQSDTSMLRKLTIQNYVIGDTPLYGIINARLQNITHLALPLNSLGNISCKYISQCSLTSLRSLNLCYNNIQDLGLIHLQKTCLKSLNYLSLAHNKIRSNGLQYLFKAKWPRLSSIQLRWNDIGLRELRQIFKSSNSLQWIYVNISNDESYLDAKNFTVSIFNKFDKLTKFKIQ